MAATDTQNPITHAYTYDELQKLAASQIDSQISGENAPLQAQVGTYGTQETAARQNIGAEYGSLMPYVQQSAQQVTNEQNAALSAEQQVFAAAGQRMNDLHQQQAKEAQDLAQQMGGPVASGDFMRPLAPYEANMPNMQASGMLHSLGNAMTDTVEAQKFAGQVFPAMQTESEAKSDSYFKDQIKTLQDQINANEGQRSTLTNTKLNDLVTQERQFQLNLQQQHLDKVKAGRDWKATQAQLKSQKLRDALSKQAAKRAGISLGQNQQRINIERQHVTKADRLAAQRMGLSVAEFKQRVAHENQSAQVGQAKLSLAASKDAASVVDAAMGGGKPVTLSHRDYLPGGKGSVFSSHAGAYYDKQKKQYFKVLRETMTPAEWSQMSGGPGDHPVHDPQRLYDLVRGTIPQLGRKATVNLIRAKTGMRGWAPGKNMAYTGASLQSMPLGALEGIARDAGFPRAIRKAGRQALVDFILARTHGPSNPGTNP